MESAGLYLHVPFCTRVCPYCDFAVRTGGPRQRARYLENLRHEIEMVDDDLGRFDTVYLGGGTPSGLGNEPLQSVLEAITDGFPLAANTWTSMEANPEHVSDAAVARWARLGIRTLTLGVQSFRDPELSFLGREHTGAQAREAVRIARASRIPLLGIDLIFGLPGQTGEDWRRQLQVAIRLAPDHLSCYQLTVHDRTVFGKRLRAGQLREMSEEGQSELFQLTHRVLVDAGFEHYEVSNYAARPEARSRHNLKYWNHAPYLGLGPAAHSFDGSTRRWWNQRLLRDYEALIVQGARPLAGEETLGPESLALERVLFGLRCSDGIDLHALRSRTGVDLLSINEAMLDRFSRQGLLHVSDERVRPTPAGMALADLLARELAVRPAEG